MQVLALRKGGESERVGGRKLQIARSKYCHLVKPSPRVKRPMLSIIPPKALSNDRPVAPRLTRRINNDLVWLAVLFVKPFVISYRRDR